MDVLRSIALAILIIGGLNWGLIAVANYDRVQTSFGGTSIYSPSAATQVIYLLVGLSALYAITFFWAREWTGTEVDNR